MADHIAQIQQALSEQNIDGWLLADFRRNNDLALQVLQVADTQPLTRRLFYWIPASGSPSKIVHSVETHTLDHLPGETHSYHRWQTLEQLLKELVSSATRVAMEYSPRSSIPYVSKVDAGTVDLIRSFGPEVVSSANLMQALTSVLSPQQIESHRHATGILDEAVAAAWERIADALKNGVTLTDFEVQQGILDYMHQHGCTTSSGPTVAVNADAADPHYLPVESQQVPIEREDFILIDLWCKQDLPGAIYGDICRVAFAGDQASDRHKEIFQIVRRAQLASLELIQQRCAKRLPIRGWEADQAAREVIETAGYGEYFTHRTGHNIGIRSHGDGAHLDNFESQDDRILLPGTCFSVEPGIYLPGEFGVRLECDCLIHQDYTVEITGGQQDSLLCLLNGTFARS